MKRKNILMSVFTMLFVFNGIYAFQVNAAVSQRNSDALINSGTYVVDNYARGWAHGNLKSSDSNGYNKYYVQNTTKGGYKYQNVWLDSDRYPIVSMTKANGTASVSKGVKSSFTYGFRDYN